MARIYVHVSQFEIDERKAVIVDPFASTFTVGNTSLVGGRKPPRMELTLYPDILEVKDGKVQRVERTTLADAAKGRKKAKRVARPFVSSLVMPERRVLDMKFRRVPRHPKP